MNYWLHRISHHAEVSYPLLKKGILSIGWSGLGGEEFIGKCQNKFAYFEQTFIAEGWDLARNRYSLWRFIAEMKKDDIVLIPSWGTFSVYQIAEDLPFGIEKLDVGDLKDWNGRTIVFDGDLRPQGTNSKEDVIDLGFFRKVNPILLDIPRSEYADQPLTSRMKIRTTNANISDIGESVRNAVQSFEHKKPINLHGQIIEKTNSHVLSLIRTQLNPDKFESLVEWYCKKAGATSVTLPSKNESGKKGDADIVATFDQIKTIIYVQAKHHVNETSEWALEQIREYKLSKDSMDDGYARIGWVISSADKFSKQCDAAAKEAHVILINGAQFATMLLNIGLSKLEDSL